LALVSVSAIPISDQWVVAETRVNRRRIAA